MGTSAVSICVRVESVLLRGGIVPVQANVEVWYSNAYSNGVAGTTRSLDWRRGARRHPRGRLEVAAGALINTMISMHVCVLIVVHGVSGFRAQLPYDLQTAPAVIAVGATCARARSAIARQRSVRGGAKCDHVEGVLGAAILGHRVPIGAVGYGLRCGRLIVL